MTDVTLGDVLVQMGLVSREQLDELQGRLTNASAEEKWGLQLVAHELITKEDLDRALLQLRALTSADKGVRAEAAAEICEVRTASVLSMAKCVALKAADVRRLSDRRRAETGDAFPAVPALASGAED